MLIRRVNFDDGDEFHDFYTNCVAAERVETPDRPMWSEREMFLNFSGSSPDEEHVVLGAFEDGDGGRQVGGAFAGYPLMDNPDIADIHVVVPPEHRGRGYGSLLLDAIVTQAGADGRHTLLAEARYGFDRRDDHPYRLFAEHRGFALASTEIIRRLYLPVSDEQIQAWLDEAAPHHAAYTLQTHVDTVPDALLPSFCEVQNRLMVDAPTGDIDFEAENLTPDVWRQKEEHARAKGIVSYHTVALDGTGDVVALTTLDVPTARQHSVHQQATIVQREHRGHRLGLAAKAMNLRALQLGHPDRTFIHTSNDEANDPMVGINERLGFVAVQLNCSFQRRLPA